MKLTHEFQRGTSPNYEILQPKRSSAKEEDRQDKNDNDCFERVATRLSINVGFQCNVYDYIQ